MDPHILLVAEDSAVRERLEKLLRQLRYDVALASSPDEALACLRSSTPTELVVVDLPAAEAQRFRRAQKQDAALAQIALLAIGDADVDADAHVPVPVDAFVLYEQLTRLRAQARQPEQWHAGAERGADDLLPFLKQSLQTMVDGLPAALAAVRSLNAGSANVEQLMQEAMQNGAKVEAYLSYLNAFNEGSRGARAPRDIRKTIEAVLAVWASKLGQRAVLHKQLGDVPLVVASDEQLSQLFFSLIINAAHAIPMGNAEGNRIEVSTFSDETGWAVAEVSDTGSGIPAELLTKIFEPFYTTKRGVGLGMGLFVVRNIVTMLRGRIGVQSEVGRGTTFRVTLPPARTGQ